MFRDTVALQTTLEKDGAERLDLPPAVAPLPTVVWRFSQPSPTWLACTWPCCLQTPSQVSQAPLGATLQLVRAPVFHLRSWLLVAVVAKGRSVMGCGAC